MAGITNPMEIYKVLPKTNCGECRVPSCLAFAAAVIKADKKLGDCPYLPQNLRDQATGRVETREAPDALRQEQLAELRQRIAALDLGMVAGKIGAAMVGGQLAIKSLGKDFRVDAAGGVTSQCHTHAGLTIPLLQYILSSSGKDIEGNWVPFRELQNGGAMAPLFGQRSEKPLKQIADTHPDLFADLIHIFSGERSENDFGSDVSLVLYPLPKLPILICYWQAEDDLDSVLNIFFDATAPEHLPIASIYALGAGLVMMFEKIVHRHS